MENRSGQPVASPCIRQCSLNAHDICRGCFRSITEITQWSLLDSQARQGVMSNADRRKHLHNKKYKTE
ncbi:MAG TPA: DUF1289 domain-containing protein [Methylococcaceae bacterium]|nr:DUF1289 domain-containing protein [Methylococcaceae bacterium]